MQVATIILAALLLIVTGVYAYFTQQLVAETRATRLLSIRPRLALDWEMRTGMVGKLAIKNLGPGHAHDVRVTLTFEPLKGEKTWRRNTLLTGESRHVMLPEREAEEGGVIPMQELADMSVRARMRGRARDVLGNEHDVDEEMDIGAWWTVAVAAHEALPGDPVVTLKGAIREVAKAIRESGSR